MTKEEKQYKELLETVKTFLHDIDDANESSLTIIMTNGMWLQVEAMRRLMDD